MAPIPVKQTVMQKIGGLPDIDLANLGDDDDSDSSSESDGCDLVLIPKK